MKTTPDNLVLLSYFDWNGHSFLRIRDESNPNINAISLETGLTFFVPWNAEVYAL